MMAGGWWWHWNATWTRKYKSIIYNLTSASGLAPPFLKPSTLPTWMVTFRATQVHKNNSRIQQKISASDEKYLQTTTGTRAIATATTRSRAAAARFCGSEVWPASRLRSVPRPVLLAATPPLSMCNIATNAALGRRQMGTVNGCYNFRIHLQSLPWDSFWHIDHFGVFSPFHFMDFLGCLI